MPVFQNIEEVGSAFVQAAQEESDKKFLQGDIIVQALADGFRMKDIIPYCASQIRCHTRTVFNRLRVSRAFPPDKRDDGLVWSFHLLCANTDSPDEWLELASKGYLDADGQPKDHTVSTLKLAMKAAGENPDAGEPVMLLDGVEATIINVGNQIISLIIATPDMPAEWQGMTVRISLLQTFALELEKE
jgi:hypothetical protein